MNDAASPPSLFARLERFNNARTTVPIAAAIVAAAVAWAAWLSPGKGRSPNQYETTRDILSLYRLQVSYKKAKGVYADNLDSLLAVYPDGAAIKARMARHLDIGTLVVDGDAEKFKLEANALDAQRTLIRISGPQDGKFGRARQLAEPAPASGIDEGAPIAPRPAR